MHALDSALKTSSLSNFLHHYNIFEKSNCSINFTKLFRDAIKYSPDILYHLLSLYNSEDYPRLSKAIDDLLLFPSDEAVFTEIFLCYSFDVNLESSEILVKFCEVESYGKLANLPRECVEKVISTFAGLDVLLRSAGGEFIRRILSSHRPDIEKIMLQDTSVIPHDDSFPYTTELVEEEIHPELG